VLKILLTEQLAPCILSRYASLIYSADVCWALRVWKGKFALPILDDPRWRRGTSRLLYSTESCLARWAHAVVISQTPDGQPLSPIERAILSYGLEMRLWYPAMAKAFLAQSVMETGKRMGDLAVDVVAGDPYLRDAFEHADGIKAEVGSVRVHRVPGALPRLRQVLETLAANWWLRRMAFRVHQRFTSWRSQPRMLARTRGRRKTAAFFVLNQRYMDLFQSVLSELESRGWYVPVFYYNPLTRPPTNAVAFADAAVGGKVSAQDSPLVPPRWVISDALLRESSVSQPWIAGALSASWAAAKTQIHRHRRVLEFLRPDTVISFGPETMSLALQSAARSMGIPSLLMAHGFQGPAQSSYFFAATACAVTGPACAAANKIDRYGARLDGIIATGHPPYDMLFRTAHGCSNDKRQNLSRLGLLGERPYIVLAFAWWGYSFVGHAIHWRSLKMLVEALPDDACLVYKLHPSFEEREFCESVLSAGLPKAAFRIVGEAECSTPELLEACHVVVMHVASMSLADAIVMGRPTIALEHEEFPCTAASVSHHINLNHPAWAVKDVCWRVRNSVELRRALVALTRDEGARKEKLRYRRKFIEEFLVAPDGCSTQRVADLVEHLGSGKSPDSFIPIIGESLVSGS